MPAKSKSTLPTKALDSTNIKGKEYVEVPTRLKYFRETYGTELSLVSKIVHLTDDVAVVEAQIKNTDGVVIANGLAREVRTDTSSFVNKTSYLENCETSAWGRALANFGIGIDTSIASANEVANAIAQREAAPSAQQVAPASQPAPSPWNQPQQAAPAAQPQPTQQTPPWQTHPQQHPQQQAAPAPAPAAPTAAAPQAPSNFSANNVDAWLATVNSLNTPDDIKNFVVGKMQELKNDTGLYQQFQQHVVNVALNRQKQLTQP